MFGREPNFPNSLQLNKEDTSHPTDILQHQQNLQNIWDFVRATLSRQQAANKERVLFSNKEVKYRIGDVVRLHYPKTLNKLSYISNKFKPYYFGNYTILKQFNTYTYQVQCQQTNRKFMCHVKRMRSIQQVEHTEDDTIDLCLTRDLFLDEITRISSTLQLVKEIQFENLPVKHMEFEMYLYSFEVIPDELSDLSKFSHHKTKHCTIIKTQHDLDTDILVTQFTNEKQMQITLVLLNQSIPLDTYFHFTQTPITELLIFTGPNWIPLAIQFIILSMSMTPRLPSIFNLLTKFQPFCRDFHNLSQQLKLFAINFLKLAKDKWLMDVPDIEITNDLVDLHEHSDDESNETIQPPIPAPRRSKRNRRPPLWLRDYVP